ncbi:MAG: prepilin-type N-terminal cleavage/methylation domain-containing protein [Gemmatimonadota bacterium]
MIRRGFTLIEVMIALMVSGMVATLAYAAAQAGFDTDARVSTYRDGVARDGVVRAILTDALRHQVDGVRGGATVFTLTDRSDADGRAADSLDVVTRGVAAPLGASATWRLSVWRAGDTLRIEGSSLDGAAADRPPFSMRLDGVIAFEVRTLGRGLSARWQAQWRDDDVAPDAFALLFARRDEHPEPLVVRRGLERAP